MVKRSVNMQRTRVRAAAAWNDDAQLLPIDADEAMLEIELDDMPPGLMVPSALSACVIMILMAALAEFTLLQANGFTGPAVFFPTAAVLLAVGIPRRCLCLRTIVLGGLLAGVSYRLAVHGTWTQVGIACWLLVATVLSMRHQAPFVVQTIVFGIESFWAGFEFFLSLHRRMTRALALPSEERSSPLLFNLGLPLLVLVSMAGLLMVIRPELLQGSLALGPQTADAAWKALGDINLVHIGVWGLVMWVTAGLLRPVLAVGEDPPAVIEPAEGEEFYHAPFFVPLRNTLLVVLFAFAGFLWLEFRLQRSEEFSAGVNFAAYAQAGLNWLAVGSAGVVFLLCVIFTGSTLADTRIRMLRRLSYLLVGLNLALAALVTQRFLHYIRFNGLSQMKVLGVLLVGTMVGTLLLTLWMCIRQQNVVWLLRRCIWLAAFSGYLFFVSPVDRMIQDYNVTEILGGNPGPIAQITRREVDDETVSALLPLCEASDPVIREGALAIVANRLQTLENSDLKHDDVDWTSVQLGVRKSYMMLQKYAAQHDLVAAAPMHDQAHHRLKQYSQQWW